MKVLIQEISPLIFKNLSSKVCIVLIHAFLSSMELKNQVLSNVSCIFCGGMIMFMLMVVVWFQVGIFMYFHEAMLVCKLKSMKLVVYDIYIVGC